MTCWIMAARIRATEMGPHESRQRPFMQTYLIFKKAGVTAVDILTPLVDCLNAVLGGHVEAAPVSYGGTRDHIKPGMPGTWLSTRIAVCRTGDCA